MQRPSDLPNQIIMSVERHYTRSQLARAVYGASGLFAKRQREPLAPQPGFYLSEAAVSTSGWNIRSCPDKAQPFESRSSGRRLD